MCLWVVSLNPAVRHTLPHNDCWALFSLTSSFAVVNAVILSKGFLDFLFIFFFTWIYVTNRWTCSSVRVLQAQV